MPIPRPASYYSVVWLLRFVWFVILCGLFYFVTINLVLNLPATQSLLNKTVDTRWQIGWEKARSLWPTDIRLQGVRAQGRGASQDWTFASSEMFASLSLVDLLDRELNVSTARVKDPVFTLVQSANRLPENSPSGDPTDDRVQSEPRTSWAINIGHAEVSGAIEFSLSEFQGKLIGTVASGVHFDTGTAEISLDGGIVDTQIERLQLGGGGRLVDRGELAGSFLIRPHSAAEHRGKETLRFLETEADVSLEADNLAFLDPWLARFRKIEIGGSGRVAGRIRISESRFQPATKLVVEAPRLTMDMFEFRAEGKGEVVLEVNPGSPEKMDASILFRQVAGYDREGKVPLIEGENLRVSATAPPALLTDRTSVVESGSLHLSIEQVAVPDLAVYQRYIPTSVPLTLKRGEGKLSAELVLDQQHFDGRISLSSDRSVVGFRQVEVASGLEIVLQVSVDSFAESVIDLSGTMIRFRDTSIGRHGKTEDDEFLTSLVIDRGQLKLDESGFGEGAARWRQLFEERDVDAMLSNAGADLHLAGTVSSLNWINNLIDNPYGLTVRGGGSLNASLQLDDGRIAPGSALEVTPENLRVAFLNYAVTGQGSIGLDIKGDAQTPDIGVRLEVRDGKFGRQDETATFVEVDEFRIEADARQVGAGQLATTADSEMKMRVRMPAARVTDMTAYNSYLPASSPLRFTGGAASLSVDIALEPKSARGRVVLRSDGVSAMIDDQQIEAELGIDLEIVDGVPVDMQFDVSGSTVVIDQVRIQGDAAAFGSGSDRNESWNMTLGLDRANVRWRKPMEIDAELSLRMKDTLPMVAVLANNRGEYGWLEKLLTVEDVRGTASLEMHDQRIDVPYLMIEADDIQLGAKAGFEGDRRAGVVYARYKGLNGLLKFAGAERNFDILKARQKFEQYDVSSAELIAMPPGPDIPDSTPAVKPARQVRGDARSDEDIVRNPHTAPKPDGQRGSSSQSRSQQPTENAR